MEEQLRARPSAVLEYDRRGPDRRTGHSGAARWRYDVHLRAHNELFPHLASDEASAAYVRKVREYQEFGLRLMRLPDLRYRSVVDPRRGRSYLYRENPAVRRIMRLIATELVSWYEHYPADRPFYRYGWFLRFGVEAGFGIFLQERPDLVMLLRIAQTLPLDAEISDIPVDRPASVEAVELVIGLIPVVGNLVAAYEAYAGVDLFGYRLTPLERGILGASVLLPLAGRIAKGGRLLYTEARLVSLYGRDAAAWSRTIRVSQGAATHSAELRAVREAEAAIRTQRTIDRTVGQRAASALPTLVRAAGPGSSPVDQAVVDLLRDLTSRHASLRGLDEYALQRILDKGPNVNHLKGQLLEEILEARVVPWLRDRVGSFALGVETGGRQLEFIPGHIIRDANGRQITDGILATRNQGVLEIAAVFEAKAGRHAARELSRARGGRSSLTEVQRAELRAYARDVWREQRAAAQEAGQPFDATIEQIEREVALSEVGGQVRRDIERLAQNAGGPLTEIRVGTELLPVRISPTNTKFFGVLPRDVNRSLIERELEASGFSFEIIGVDIGQRDLRTIASEMVSLATTMANAP